MNEEKKNRPVDRIRVGAIEAAIWENPGKNGPWKSVTLFRTYKDKNGNLAGSTSLSGSDLLLAAEALRIAYERITHLPATDAVLAAAQAAGKLEVVSVP